jgi:hypothetical protein
LSVNCISGIAIQCNQSILLTFIFIFSPFFTLISVLSNSQFFAFKVIIFSSLILLVCSIFSSKSTISQAELDQEPIHQDKLKTFLNHNSFIKFKALQLLAQLLQYIKYFLLLSNLLIFSLKLDQ